MALAIKAKSTTFLEDNKEENICSLRVKKDFLSYKKHQKMIKYHFSPGRMTKLKKKKKRWTISHVSKKVGQMKISYMVVRMCKHFGSWFCSEVQVKHILTIWYLNSIPGYLSNSNKRYAHVNSCTGMLMAAVIRIVQNWKQPKVHQEVKKKYIHTI